MKTKSINEINSQRKSVLDAYRAADSNGVACYEMFVVNPILSSEPHSMFRGNNRELGKGSSYCTFEEHLDTLLDNPDIASIRVKIWGQKKSDEKADLTITIRTPYNDRGVVRYYEQQVPTQEKEKPASSVQQTSSQHSDINSVQSLISLLGLGGLVDGGLGSINQDATGGLCAILDVRDKLKEQEFERIRQDERSLIAKQSLANKDEEIAALKAQIRTLNDSYNSRLLEYQRQLEENNRLMKKMQERCDEAEAEIERVNPNNSVFGVALSGLLANCGQMLIRRNAGLLGGLMGIDKDTITAMLDGSDDTSDSEEPNSISPEAAPVVEVQVAQPTDIIAPEVIQISTDKIENEDEV